MGSRTPAGREPARQESQQLTLDIPGLGAFTLTPTIAMKRGEQSVFQCAWCGCVVVQPKPADQVLGPCPSCRKPDTTWRNQPTPIGHSLAGLQVKDADA